MFKSSRPSPSPCPRCGKMCLSGWAEGLRVRVDLTTVPRTLYPVAILRRVSLFWLDPIGLAYLDQYRMKVAGHNRYPVLPAHRCAIAWPSDGPPADLSRTDDTIPY